MLLHKGSYAEGEVLRRRLFSSVCSSTSFRPPAAAVIQLTVIANIHMHRRTRRPEEEYIGTKDMRRGLPMEHLSMESVQEKYNLTYNHNWQPNILEQICHQVHYSLRHRQWKATSSSFTPSPQNPHLTSKYSILIECLIIREYIFQINPWAVLMRLQLRYTAYLIGVTTDFSLLIHYICSSYTSYTKAQGKSTCI